MRAIAYDKHGGPEVLHAVEMPKPQAKKGEVVVRTIACTYNPVDVAFREGTYPVKLPLPTIPGCELSGIVEELGEGVSGFKVGDAVIAELSSHQGASAQFAAVPADDLVMAPNSMDLADAAGVPLDSLTAWQGLYDFGKLKAGQRILIVGAGGTVGGFAVQFAKLTGAYIVATASGNDIERVKGLGADEVIDYKKENVVDVVKTPFDAVFDFSPAKPSLYYPVVKSDGILVTAHTPADGIRIDGNPRDIQAVFLAGKNDPALLEKIVAMIDRGEVALQISERLTLDDIPAVHANPPHGGKCIFLV